LEAEEEEHRRGPRPRDLANAFDRVGERQVFRTPSANVAVAMASLDRLPDQPWLSPWLVRHYDRC
jgi:hypothetical protein